jgi:hypothetical protein
MAPAPNVQDPAPSTEEELSAYVGAAQTACYTDFSVRFDPASMTYGDSQDTKFVRTGLEAGDPKTYDSGQLFTASSLGPQTTPVIGGGLWAHYDVELFDAKETNTQQELIETLITVGSVAQATTLPPTGAPDRTIIPYEAWFAASPDAALLTSLNTLFLQTMLSLGHPAAIEGVWYIPRGRYAVTVTYDSTTTFVGGGGAVSLLDTLQTVNADVGLYPNPLDTDFLPSSELPAAKTFRVYGSTPNLVGRTIVTPAVLVNETNGYSGTHRFFIEADAPNWFAIRSSFTLTSGAVTRAAAASSRIFFEPA